MSSREIIRLLKDDGWYFVKTKGSHHKFKHPTKRGSIIVPHPKKDIPKGTELEILRQAGLVQ